MKKMIFILSLSTAIALQAYALPLPHRASWPEANNTALSTQQRDQMVTSPSTITPLQTTFSSTRPFSTTQPPRALSSHEILVDALEVVSIFMIFATIALIQIHLEKRNALKAATSQE